MAYQFAIYYLNVSFIHINKTAKAIASIADAVVIGSRLVQEIESSSSDSVIGNLSTLLGGIRRAMDEA